MAEAVTVVGFVSSIACLIDSSAKLASQLQELSSEALDVPTLFRSLAMRLPLLTTSLRLIADQAQAGSLLSDMAKKLQSVVEHTATQVSAIQTCLSNILPLENTSRVERTVKTLKSLAKEDQIQSTVDIIHKNIDFLALNHTNQHVNMREYKLEAVSEPMQTSDQSSLRQHGHSYPNVSVRSHSQLHLGDINYFGALSDQCKRPNAIKAFGLCLDQAPQIAPTCFIGRASELSAMSKILEPEHRSIEQRRLILGGIGGVGKTQLAIAYVRNYGNCYDSVFWLDATSETTMKASFRLIAQRILRAQEYENLDDEHTLTQVREWLSDTGNIQWLLIFDNYDDTEQFDVGEYYPCTTHGSIIVTTRLPDRVNGIQVRIQPLQRVEEGLDILQTRSGRDGVRTDPYAQRLAMRLEGFPLALATAGAYLRKSTFTFERYLQEFEKRFNFDPPVALRLNDHQHRTIYTTWSLSYARLEKDDPNAAKMLKLLAYFDNQKIWYELLHAHLAGDLPIWLQDIIGDLDSFKGVMRTLVNYSLVDFKIATQSYSMHSLVHDWTLAELNQVTDARQYWYAFDCVAAMIREGDWESLGHYRYAPLTTHATWLLHNRFLQDGLLDRIIPDRLNSALRIAQLLMQQVQLRAAEQMYLRILVGCVEALGPDHASTLNTANNLGILYRAQGKLDQAEQMYLRALVGYEKALGPDHTSTLHTVHNLGVLYRNQHKLEEAEQMYRRALRGRYNALGPDHISTLDTVHSLGNLYFDQGKLDEAEQMYTRALVGKEKALGPGHTSTLQTINSLGNLYRDQAKLDMAEQMYTRALAGYEKALGFNHTSTLDAVHNLGLLYSHQGELDKGEHVYMRALAGYEIVLGSDHLSTLGTVNNLGLLYAKQGKLDEAEQMYTRTLAGKEKALGPDHTSTLSTVHNLGNLYADQGKLDKAEQMYQRALRGKEKALGPEHSSTLGTVNNLGVLYTNQGKLDKAEQMYMRVLAGEEKALGPAHTSTLQTIYNLGTLYADQGKLDKAEKMYLQALAGMEEKFGVNHPSTLDTVHNLGLLYTDQGRLDEAEQMYLRALRGMEKVLGHDHPSTLNTINNLGLLYADQGRLSDAEQMFNQADINRARFLATDE